MPGASLARGHDGAQAVSKAPGRAPVLAHLTARTDFEQALGRRPVIRSTHFSLHHAARDTAPGPTRRVPDGVPAEKLSTGVTDMPALTVDECCGATSRHLIGVTLPRRLARRAVTRSLLRRLAYAALQRLVAAWPEPARSRAGVQCWVLRLRAGFDRKAFPSASSRALRVAVRDELDLLVTQALAQAARA